MRYPHQWLCVRTSGGSQDATSGKWDPGAANVVYSGPADCQDGGERESRDSEGRLVVESVATLFLKDASASADHRTGDVGTVTWEDGSSDDAEVVEVRRLDGTLELRWL